MARRDVFTGLRNSHPTADVEKMQPDDFSTSIKQPLDLIPTADRKKKRSRNWEQAHRSETATYRGIPPHIVELINRLAISLSVPRDEVLRAFLEYSIMRYRSGDLILFVYPKSQRMTLFPQKGQKNSISASQKNTDQKWLSEAFPVPEKKSSKPKKEIYGKNKDSIPQWEMRVTFRIPVTLKEEIRLIAREHTLPVGEVVWFFVNEGNKALQNGSLLLQPSPKSIGKTLFPGGCE